MLNFILTFTNVDLPDYVVIEARQPTPIIPLQEITYTNNQELSLFDNEPVSLNLNTIRKIKPKPSPTRRVAPKSKASKRRKIPPPQAPPTFTASQFEQMQTRQDAVTNNNIIEGMEMQN